MNQEARDIRNLINLLNKYTEAYDKGTPIISDKDWDSMYFKLAKMEQETRIIYSDYEFTFVSLQNGGIPKLFTINISQIFEILSKFGIFF